MSYRVTRNEKRFRQVTTESGREQSMESEEANEARDPTTGLTRTETERGLQNIIRLSLSGQAMGTLTGGAFIVAVLVLFDAPLYVFGLLAALPALAETVKVPAAYAIERYGKRKRIAFYAFVGTRLSVLGLVAIALLFDTRLGIILLLATIVLKSTFGAVAGAAWTPMVRDLVPSERMGGFFARRQKLTVGLSIPLSLLAGWFVARWADRFSGRELEGYAILFLIGFLAGLTGLYFVWRTPEPAMPPLVEPTAFKEIMTTPFRDENFRNLMLFLGSWGFAMSIATPFFTVYLLTRIGLDMATVIQLTVLSQVANVAFVEIWGRLADRYSAKSVLSISGPLVLGTTILWLFTLMPEPHRFTMGLLVVIFLLRGMSMAGVSLATGTIAMRLAPQGRGTAFLAANSFVVAIAGASGPLLGGAIAGFFEDHRFTIILNWEAPHGVIAIPAFHLQGVDFAFLAAFLIGLYAMHRLTLVEEGERIERSIVVQNLFEEIKRPIGNYTTASGVIDVLDYPLDAARQTSRHVREFGIRNGRGE